MRRDTFVQNKVVQIYKDMDVISFPICPQTVLSCVPKKCRILSYQELAQRAQCSVEDIIAVNKSSSGATNYDKKSGRFLILYNADMNDGRVRWTLIHEIGHIYLEHIEMMQSGTDYDYEEFETEADFFTWNLLAPLPLIHEMGAVSSDDVKRLFGLSSSAASIQYNRYLQWKKPTQIPPVRYAGNFKLRAMHARENSILAMEKSILMSYHRKGKC